MRTILRGKQDQGRVLVMASNIQTFVGLTTLVSCPTFVLVTYCSVPCNDSLCTVRMEKCQKILRKMNK